LIPNNEFNSDYSQTTSKETASRRLNHFFNHSNEFIEQIKYHYVSNESNEKIIEIFTQTQNVMDQIRADFMETFNQSHQETLSSREVKSLGMRLKQAEKMIAKTIRETQLKVLVTLGQAESPEAETLTSEQKEQVQQKITLLANGGFKAFVVKFLSAFSKADHMALKIYTSGLALMARAIARRFDDIDTNQLTEIDRDRLAEFTRGDHLRRRAHVIGVQGTFSVGVSFGRSSFLSVQEGVKQFRSFIAQKQSEKQRTVIERNIQDGTHQFTTTLRPLNNSFSNHITDYFGKLFGEKGISSANRQEGHLVNAWQTELRNTDQGAPPLFRAFRHAIASDKHERNLAKRKENSEKAATELLKAAFLQQLSDMGLSLQDAMNLGKPITLNFNSVSLVTPDLGRSIHDRYANERRMWDDQRKALKSFCGNGRSLNFNGIEIPIKLNLATFNFGVNAGALGQTLRGVYGGVTKQYAENKKSFKGLRKQTEELKQYIGEHLPKSVQSAAIIGKEIRNIDLLLADIELLLKDKKAYHPGNQYEVGAKILNLTNCMDKIIKEYNEHAEQGRRLPGFSCAFNCMSGKDRTGVMDAIAKTFAAMAAKNDGVFRTRHELMNQQEVKEEFIAALEKFLMESGNHELNEVNIDAAGYKTGQAATIFYGLTLHVIDQMAGIAKTT
jgi:hypothetical protein